MTGKYREESKSGFYHVMIRGVNRQNIFIEDSDRQHFIFLLKKCSLALMIEVHAFCLMDNHVHILVKSTKIELSLFMHKILTSYVKYYNYKTGRVGHLVQNRFKSEPVNDEHYYLTVLRYILQNPENALICKTKDYKWSSIGAYDHKSFVKTEFALSLFSCKKDLISFLFEKNSDECMDLQLTREEKETKDSIVIRYIIGKQDLKSLSIPKRNFYINCMKKNGISIRRISKVTGLSIGMIQRA